MSGGDGFVEIKLCAPCAKLDFRDVALGQSKQPRFSDSDGTWDFSDCVPHHDGLEELIECARTSDGCELCKALALKWTARGESFRWPSGEEYGWYDDAKATLEKEPRLRKCVLVLGPYYQFPLYEAVKTTGVALWNIEGDADLQPEIPLGFAKFYLRRDCLPPASSPFAQTIRTRDICKNSRTPECMAIARSWLKDCLDNHDLCKGPSESDRRLPSRAIDVGDEDHDPKLIVTGDIAGEYAVLSYCWGQTKHQHMTLTQENLAAFQESIPMSMLPMTLRDAIYATRELGIRYLWIDALCIIQDSVDDWTHEAGSMNTVYKNAVVALFATTAASAAEGFLGEREISPVQYLMPPSVWSPSNSNANDTGQEDDLNVFLALNDWGAENDDAYHRDPKIYPWVTRGWTMQERLSSSRGISFNKLQMAWNCLARTGRENQLYEDHELQQRAGLLDHVSTGLGAALLASLSERWNILTRIQDSQLGCLGMEIYEKLALQLWYRLVNHYCTRRLSNESDRLPAIAGLAKTLEDRMPGNHYLAGLWEGDLVLGLSWSVNENSYSSCIYSAQSSTKQRSVLVPSWSWASTSHASYATYNFHDDTDGYITESLAFIHQSEVSGYMERFIPRKPLVLQMTAPAMRLSDNWHSTEHPMEEQDLAQVALETLLRMKILSNQASKQEIPGHITEDLQNSEFFQKHEPYPGQHFLVIQIFQRTPKDFGFLVPTVDTPSMFFLVLESVLHIPQRYRRVLELYLAEGNFRDTETDFILERHGQKIYKGNLLCIIREQQWRHQDIELE